MKNAVRAAVAKMILSHAEWDLWISLTFEPPKDEEGVTSRRSTVVSPETANAILKKWARRAATRIGAHFKIAFVRENQSGGFPHFHVLVAQPDGMHDGLRPRGIVTDWKWASSISGHAKAVYFDPARAESCADYMTKCGEVEFQVACPRQPRCRRTGCVEAPGPWNDRSC